MVIAGAVFFALVQNGQAAVPDCGPTVGNYQFCYPTGYTPTSLTSSVPEYLNASAITQKKFGNLSIGGAVGSQLATSKLCLNADPNALGINDTLNCISSWKEIKSIVSSYLRLQTYATGKGPTDTPDVGYIVLEANPALQTETIVGGTLPRPGIWPDHNQTISLLTEANWSSTKPTSGLSAAATAQNAYAGLFVGQVYVEGSICLPPDHSHPTGCVTSLPTAIATPPDIIHLQNTTTYFSDAGSASVSGTLSADTSIVVGTPNYSTDARRYCGDGLCSPEAGETNNPLAAGYCANDCP